MSVLYVVRHGQASFFSDNYDQLSPLGIEQARRLGEYWLAEGIGISEVYCGSLVRQQQTAHAVGEVFRLAGQNWPEPSVVAGLNEYLADDVMEALRAELVEKHDSVRRLSQAYDNASNDRERYRTFHLLLEKLIGFYIEGDYEAVGFETWRQFHDRVTSSLDGIRSCAGRGRQVAVFTSGGPVGVSVQSTLAAPEQQAGELNWRVYNASVTRFTFRSDRISLDQFNSIAHLPTDDWRTYR